MSMWPVNGGSRGSSTFQTHTSSGTLIPAPSNVDTRTEKAIQEAMRTIMKERTGIVIAHRISTIRNADMIIVMENGAVVERGRHNDLLQQHGKYYELYMTQYAGQET